MRSNPGSDDLIELNRQETMKQNRTWMLIFSALHYYCCYVPCSIIYND